MLPLLRVLLPLEREPPYELLLLVRELVLLVREPLYVVREPLYELLELLRCG